MTGNFLSLSGGLNDSDPPRPRLTSAASFSGPEPRPSWAAVLDEWRKWLLWQRGFALSAQNKGGFLGPPWVPGWCREQLL